MAQGKKLLDEPQVISTVEDMWNNRNNKDFIKPPPPSLPPLPKR